MHTGDRTLNKVWNNLSNILDAITSFRSLAYPKSQLLDSWTLWAHYRATVCLFFVMFAVVTTGWFADYPMECVNMYDRSEVWDYFKGLCLSYSYTNASRTDDNNEADRVYAAHYRWVHWVLLFLMFLYYLPLLAARSCTLPISQKILLDIASCGEEHTERELQAALLFVEELGWNAFVYKYCILSHVFALFINVLGIMVIDTLLQNNFLTLVISLYPFARDSQHFSDPLSLLFPPFVTCKVGPEMMLNNYRTEVIGCHLLLMELYEKFFIGLWFWLLALMIGTLLKIFSSLLTGCSVQLKKRLVDIGVEKQEGDAVLVVARYSVGDLMVLAKLKQVLDSQLYRLVLHHAAYIEWPDYFDEDYIPEPEPVIPFQ